jgi:predicted transposase/invertase (TIGR01784 family)
MPDESIHQPHDKLFKAGFSDPETAAGLLRAELPETITSKIDWDRLRLEPGSFVDSHYRDSESDLLFSAPFCGVGSGGGDCLVYILFEHQSSQDALLALRLLRYMVRIWERLVGESEGGRVKLPVILPVVLAQNAEVWSVSQRFADLLDIPTGMEEDLQPFIPDFVTRLIQLADLPFEAICGTPAGIMILRTMKAERLNRLLDDLVWDETLMLQIPRETLELLIRYMLSSSIDRGAFDRKVLSIKQNELQNATMTLADQLREHGLEQGLEQGLERGRQEGRQDGLRQGIVEALEIRFGSISEGLRDELAAIRDLEHLRVLHKASIQAASLEEFSKSL